jgi:hypothetical protein
VVTCIQPTDSSPSVTRLHPQATIGPQLPFAAEPVRRLISAIKRAARIGPMQGIWRSSFAALCFRLSAKTPVAPLAARPGIHPAVEGASQLGGVPRLAQLLVPIARGIDQSAATGNSPTAIHGLEPIHHPCQIF